MNRELINTETWNWECVATHQGPALLGPWDAAAYVAEGPRGWYASAEGQKKGLDYIYRLPGRKTAQGPYSHEEAVGIARGLIGLAPEADQPEAGSLVLFRPAPSSTRSPSVVKDVTGQVWVPFNLKASVTCTICGSEITQGWSQGRWSVGAHYICDTHVEIHECRRPAES
jgi:hypothetical protein